MDTLVTLYGVPRVTPLFSCEKETHNVAVFGKKRRVGEREEKPRV